MTRVYSATGKRSLTNNTSIEKVLLFGNTNTLTIQLGKKGCCNQEWLIGEEFFSIFIHVKFDMDILLEF